MKEYEDNMKHSWLPGDINHVLLMKKFNNAQPQWWIQMEPGWLQTIGTLFRSKLVVASTV